MLSLRLFAILLGLIANVAQAGQIYKWVDKDGQVHVTQTPPPGMAVAPMEGGKKTVVRGSNPAEMRKYCLAVQKVAREIAMAAAGGESLEAMASQARFAESELFGLGAAKADLRQIVYFVYGMQGGLRRGQVSPDGVAQLAHDNCLSGSFAVVSGERPPASAQGQQVDPQSQIEARSGTGWFVAEDKVVTSLHVVDGMRSIRLHFADGSSASARLALSDRRHDVAVLSTAPRRLIPLEVRGDPLSLGATVFTIGFPHSDVMGVKPKLSNGVISSTTGIRDDDASYQISVPVQAGNSGGPLLDMNGHVVGVVAAKLRAERMYETTGDLTENVNYAIKSAYVVTLAGIATSNTAEAPRSLETLARELQPSIVRIVATQ